MLLPIVLACCGSHRKASLPSPDPKKKTSTTSPSEQSEGTFSGRDCVLRDLNGNSKRDSWPRISLWIDAELNNRGENYKGTLVGQAPGTVPVRLVSGRLTALDVCWYCIQLLFDSLRSMCDGIQLFFIYLLLIPLMTSGSWMLEKNTTKGTISIARRSMSVT